MQYSSTLILSIFMAGAAGGTLSMFNASGETRPVDIVIADARSSFRDTMRGLDSAYYRRGDDYRACAKTYGERVAGNRTNGDITLSCECFDKSLRMLGGLDRNTALMALGPVPAAQTSAHVTVTLNAGRVLRHCSIEPWTGGAPDELRGAL